jgi:hypothetical protein
LAVFPNAQTAAENIVEEIVVNTDYRQSNINEIPSSLTVIDENLIQRKNAQHLEDILGNAPNVNFLREHLVRASIKSEVLEREVNFLSRSIHLWGSSLMALTLAVLAMRLCSMTLSK